MGLKLRPKLGALFKKQTQDLKFKNRYKKLFRIKRNSIILRCYQYNKIHKNSASQSVIHFFTIFGFIPFASLNNNDFVIFGENRKVNLGFPIAWLVEIDCW